MTTLKIMKEIEFFTKEGKHRSKPLFLRWFRGYGSYSFIVRLHDSMWYPPDDVKPSGINKLFGYALPFHGEKILGKIPLIKKLVNSYLVGWKPQREENYFSLFIYFDIAGKEYKELIMRDTWANRDYSVDLHIFKKHKRVIIDGDIKDYQHFYTPPFGYFLKPYFGGKARAPWNMKTIISGRFRPLYPFLLLLLLSFCKPTCRDVVIDYYDKDTSHFAREEQTLCGTDLELLEGTPSDFFLYTIKPDTVYRSWRYQ